MYDPIKKVDAEIKGVIVNIESNYFRDQLMSEKITIKCFSDKLKEPQEAYFNYSTKWKKLNLKRGDRVSFQATIKTSTYTVHKTERWHDEWGGRIPPEFLDWEDQIEIQSPKKVIKL